MITFDRFPGGKRYACTFSYDDGGKQDRRLVELFNKYGLKCTFNLNSSALIREDGENVKLKEIKELYKGHEIAAHTYNHPHLDKMTIKSQYEQIMKDREIIEPVWGNIVRGLAYPFGTYSKDTLTAMKTAGIEYARTATSQTNNFAMPDDFRIWNPTTHHNESEKIVNYFIQNVEKRPWRAGGLLYIWGHSYELDNESAPVGWEKLEEICKALSEHAEGEDGKAIWFATNIEVVDYVKATRAIRESADGKILENPTATDVWAANDNEIIKIPAGGSIVLP